MSEAAKLDEAFEDRAKHLAVFAYIGRGINLCVDRKVLDSSFRTKIQISQQGMRMVGALNISEDDLRTAFSKMATSGYISEFLDFDQVFNGVVSKGETLH
ncbi:hypothetical protein D3C80_1190490 [compost metagenome]